VVLATPHPNNLQRSETFHKPSDLDRLLGTMEAVEKGHEIWHVEYEDPVCEWFTYDSDQGISEV
jgi:hypothetical protein